MWARPFGYDKADVVARARRIVLEAAPEAKESINAARQTHERGRR